MTSLDHCRKGLGQDWSRHRGEWDLSHTWASAGSHLSPSGKEVVFE